MNSTPVELIWIGIAGGVVGIVTSVFNLLVMWRNRRRIEFRAISAVRYYQDWDRYSIENARWVGPPGTKCPIRPGSWRSAFTVVEFAIKNQYPTEVTVGRIVIDGWMFAGRYTRAMYAYKQDYRVFDLYTREATTLESYRKVPPKGSVGLRIEVLDETDGPDWEGTHSRYWLSLPEKCTVEFTTDVGRWCRKIKVRAVRADSPDFSFVYHWSDLVKELEFAHPAGAPLPQSVNYPRRAAPWRLRLRGWYWKVTRSLPRQLLYGKRWYLRSDRRAFGYLIDEVRKVRQ